MNVAPPCAVFTGKQYDVRVRECEHTSWLDLSACKRCHSISFMRDLCRDRGLPIRGSKKMILHRLKLDGPLVQDESKSTSTSTSTKTIAAASDHEPQPPWLRALIPTPVDGFPVVQLHVVSAGAKWLIKGRVVTQTKSVSAGVKRYKKMFLFCTHTSPLAHHPRFCLVYSFR